MPLINPLAFLFYLDRFDIHARDPRESSGENQIKMSLGYSFWDHANKKFFCVSGVSDEIGEILLSFFFTCDLF